MRRAIGRDHNIDEVARRAAHGDRHAFGLLCGAIEADIWRYCRSILRDHAAAQDATQETFARIVAGIRRYRGDAPVKVWALVIARRVCFEAIGKLARAPIPIDPQQHDLPARASERLAVDDVELLDELPDADRAAFVLTQLLGFSYADTAVVCDAPIGTIRSRVHRARCELARHWTESHTKRHTHNARTQGGRDGHY
jgi:RNA polymerase sigma-70 factor (ECF subfamily)